MSFSEKFWKRLARKGERRLDSLGYGPYFVYPDRPPWAHNNLEDSKMPNLSRVYEEVKVSAQGLSQKVEALIHESNVRRIIIKDDHGATFMEIPLSVATLGVIAAPVLAAVGAVATVLANFTVVVERAEPAAPGGPPSVFRATSGFGATEEQVDMKGTVAQRIDSRGTKVEDLGGVGGHDAKGG